MIVKPTKLLVLATTLLVAFTMSATAQSIDYSRSLEKRHQIELRLGMWNQVTDTRTEVGIGLVSTSVESSGFLGGLAYGHWLSESMALTVSVGAMAAKIETNSGIAVTTTETAVVSPIMFGLKQYFPSSTYYTSVRPYAMAAVGTYIGSQTKEEAGLVVVVESRTEAAMGGQIGIGADFILGRHVNLGVMMAYNLMTDFRNPIGGSKNYSGPQLVFGISYVFGRGVH